MKNLHLEKAGLVGSIITVLCCIGFGPLLAVLSAIGAGFLVNDKILAPLLVVFLLLGATGLFLSFRRHHRWPALILHLAGSAVVFIFTLLVYHQLLIWLGVLGLVAAAVWDFLLSRHSPASRSNEHG
jgi:mercuric ion transport protein